MLLLIVTLGVVAAALVAAWRGHYIFAAALFLLGAYELAGPVLLWFSSDPSLDRALAIFGEYSADQALDNFIQALAAFFVVFVASYLMGGRRKPMPVAAPQPLSPISAGSPIVPVAILLFGVISVATGAGQARFEDYVDLGIRDESSRFFAYGGLLLVAGVGIALNRLSSRKPLAALVIVACLAPLLIELFMAGRRQWFAPSALLVLIVVLYSRLRFKISLAIGFLFVVGVAFAVQFGLREEVQQSEARLQREPLALAVIAPQVGEFIAIGSTSLRAWNAYVIEQAPVTNGLHWAFHGLNTVPFLRLADTWFPQYRTELYRAYNELAPWGGLSMIADSLMAMGLTGMLLLPVAMGFLCRRAHEVVFRAVRSGMPGDAGGLYYLSLIATLLLKYRSGVGDAVQSAASFSILYWSLISLGAILLGNRTGVVALLRYQAGAAADRRS